MLKQSNYTNYKRIIMVQHLIMPNLFDNYMFIFKQFDWYCQLAGWSLAKTLLQQLIFFTIERNFAGYL